MGDVQYVEEHNKLDLPRYSQSVSSPGRSKNRRVPVSPVAEKKQFSVENPSASRPPFEAALEKSFEKLGAGRSSGDCRNGPVFRGGKIKSCWYICIDFSHLKLSDIMNSVRVAVFCAKGK